MDLAVACVDDYAAVHEIRQMEHTEFGSSSFTTQVLIVAVTDLDRYVHVSPFEESLVSNMVCTV
jgi:hypothetical protein